MDKRNILNEQNVIEVTNEYNFKNYEFNRVEIKNNYENLKYHTQKTTETNPIHTEQVKGKTKTKGLNKTNMFRLMSSFIAVCAMSAIVQTTFPIPVLSKLFSPQVDVSEVVVELPLETKKPEPIYKIKNLVSSYKDISYSVELENVEDILKANYSLLLVNKGCDNDTYINSIPTKTKISGEVKINNLTMEGKINRVTTLTSVEGLINNTEYVLLVLKEDSIVQKQEVKTKELKVVKNIKFKKVSEYLQFLVDIDSEFDNYTYLYYDIRDAKSNKFLVYSNAYIGGIPSFDIKEFGSSKIININVYCLPISLEGMNGLETMLFNEDKYFLVYTQNNVDISEYLK